MTWRELAVLLAKAIDDHIFFKVKKTVTQARPMQDFYEGVICYPLWHFPDYIAADVKNHPTILGCQDLRLGEGHLEDNSTVGFRWPTNDSENELWRDFCCCLCSGGRIDLPLDDDLELIECKDVFHCTSPEEAYLKACLADPRVANAKLEDEAVEETAEDM